MSSAPRPVPDGSNYGPEILAKLEALSARVDTVGQDAREARDGMMKISAVSQAEDIPTKIAGLSAKIEATAVASRSDLANVADKIRTEVTAIAARVTAVEPLVADVATIKVDVASLKAWRSKLDGASGLFGWFSRNWAVLAAVGAGAVALFKDGPK